MSKTAFLFPGQGSGSIKTGMGFELHRRYKDVQEIFDEASRSLGFSVAYYCFQAPEEELRRTVIAQPISLVINLSCARFLNRPVSFLAGHSVGYVAALVYSGVIDFSQGITIVQERASLMAEVCKRIPGKMVALINPGDINRIKKICRHHGISIANYNSSRQIVISGESGSVNIAVVDIIERELAERAIDLKVEGAFHSRCMRSISILFGIFLKNIPFNDPEIPIIANSNAGVITTGKRAKKELIKQPYLPVRWCQSMKVLRKQEVDIFIEAGWGNVLSRGLKGDLQGENVDIFTTQELLLQTTA